MATEAPVQIPRERLSELIEREGKALTTPPASPPRCTSGRACTLGRRRVVLPGARPLADLPRARRRPQGLDVDGNEMWDFHNGFGSMVQGTPIPAIGKAIADRYSSGTHFAAPTEDAIVVAERARAPLGPPKWRYTNSGSEATMDAIRIARGLHRARQIVKIFGSYHGHHDT